ncbi:PREDICTED: uncharacterized protein LOC106806123, partial [Priapulus caudatus]|uniref:Uncharacterized protein LOC106806123 n=1 Tax=Priapulus caudatus TaxID=37621 RepID=A0ABM1DU41_PRICU
ALLEKTSLLVTIFHDRNRAIVTMVDALDFFNQWESNALDKSLVLTRDDLNSVFGFLAMTERPIKDTISLTPGYINSDIVENFFCQQRGLCNGMATNSTISQYEPAVNAIILGQSTISKKGNTSGQNAEPMCAKRAFPLLPAMTKKCKKNRV